MISLVLQNSVGWSALNGRPVLAVPGWLGWLIATTPFWYLFASALFGAAALVVGVITVAGISALISGGAVFLILLAIAFMNKGPDDLIDADTVMDSPLVWIVFVSGLAGAGIGMWTSWSVLFDFVPNFYIFAPAVTFIVLGFLWFFTSLYTQMTGMPIGFVMPGPATASRRMLIGLPAFALWGVIAAGPVFMFTLTYIQPLVAGWWDLTAVSERMGLEWRDGLAVFRAEVVELAILTEPLLQADVLASLAIMIAITWAFGVHIGFNWLVSRSFLKSLYVFVSAFFLNLLYVILLFSLEAGQADAAALVVWISSAIASINNLIEYLFHQSLRLIFAVLPVPEAVKEYIQQLGLLPARLIGLLFDLAASLTLLSEDLRRLFESFGTFKERFDATYFFFLLASALLWSQALKLYKFFDLPPFRQIREAHQRRQAVRAEMKRLEAERVKRTGVRAGGRRRE